MLCQKQVRLTGRRAQKNTNKQDFCKWAGQSHLTFCSFFDPILKEHLNIFSITVCDPAQHIFL